MGWWAWFLVTVLPCCILLLCCAAGGSIPFLRKKKAVAVPVQVYETRPFVQPLPVPLATAAVPFATTARPATTMPYTTAAPVATITGCQSRLPRYRTRRQPCLACSE